MRSACLVRTRFILNSGIGLGESQDPPPLGYAPGSSEFRMLPLALSATRRSTTTDSAISCTTSCTGWTFLSRCSTSYVQHHRCLQHNAQSTTVRDGQMHPHLRHCSSAASASAGCHFVPRHRRSMFVRSAFSVAGRATWYSLPQTTRDPSLRDLKTFLFSFY